MWEEKIYKKTIDPQKTAFLICDLWDKHWCKTLNKRSEKIAKKVGPIVETLRARGVKIIHAPSQCTSFYQTKKGPGNFPIVDTWPCQDDPPCKAISVCTKQHPAIRIADEDLLSDDGNEIYIFLETHSIDLIIMVGVHTNMCILDRPFGIKAMVSRGMPIAIVRDLTDAAYSPKQFPFVSNDRATELVVEWIEKYYCPSILSKDLRA